MLKTIKFLSHKFIALTIIGLGLILLNNDLITNVQSKKCYNTVEEIPYNKVGLLLGTGKYLRSGYTNIYYTLRINACIKLYKSGKISAIIISGDNSRKNYDEPSTIKKDLIKKGIPAHKIYLDFAGFRTLDSIVRAKEIFGQNSFTIISQPFHNERALFLASQKSINAVAFNAEKVSLKYGYKVMIREKIARVKAVLDIIIHKNPKFLGKKIHIDI